MNKEQTMSNSVNDGGPAFPIPLESGQTWQAMGLCDGMTLRDYFAAKAMQGFCANPAVFAHNDRSGWGLVNCTESQLVDICYGMAGLMIEQRGK